MPPHVTPTLAQQIATQQKAMAISNKALAAALGYDSPQVITLIKDGRMRVPMNKARALADALDLEPGEVMRQLLRETSPELLESVEECMGPLVMTPPEVRLIGKLREVAGNQPIAPLYLEGNKIVAVVMAQ